MVGSISNYVVQKLKIAVYLIKKFLFYLPILFYILTVFFEILSDNVEKPKSKIVIVVIKMPDGKEYEIPMPAKTYSTGREGFYAQIPALVYENDIYGGQIQVWKKTPKE